MVNRIILACVFLLLSSCGFHLRNASDIPPSLRILYLETGPSYIGFSASLRRTLTAMDVYVVDAATKAPVTLKITNIAFSHNNPSITSTSDVVSYTYTFHFDYQLLDAHGCPLSKVNSIETHQSILLNAQQIYSASSDALVKPQLQQDAITLLLNRLTTQKTQQQLMKNSRLPKAHPC
ncbi:MAG TPA: hypothetical protein VJB02_02300 [Coxiellaceae bacterium]|nr:hypothetical protein [Coxiellaceae bacterium]